MAARRCTSSCGDKLRLSCRIAESMRFKPDRLWAAKAFRLQGRIEMGLQDMITPQLVALQES